jgi:hypothetical protein
LSLRIERWRWVALRRRTGEQFGAVTQRLPLGRSIDRSFTSRDRQKVKINGRSTILFGETGTLA